MSEESRNAKLDFARTILKAVVDNPLPKECVYLTEEQAMSEESDKALLPCPHCGGEAEICGPDNRAHEYWVRCKRNCTPLTMERDRAISEWNTRHRHEQTAQAIACAVEALEWYAKPHTLGKGGADIFVDMSHRAKEALAKLRAIQESGE